MTDDQLEERIAQLEQDVEAIVNDREVYRKQVLGPRLDDIETAGDDARQQRAEHQAKLETAMQRIEELERRLEMLVGLSEEETGGPTKRAVDVRQGLIRQARDASKTTQASMHWREVQNFLARVGHGSVSKPDCYKAMDWAAGDGGDLPDSAAFWMERGKRRLSNRDVKAVCVDVADLPSTRSVVPGRNPTTEETGSSSVNADD